VTEILIDADFGHPPERVWRALTDRAVLSQWFMRTDLEPYEGRRFRLVPDGLLGLAGPVEGELLEVAAPRRMVMLWRGEQLHSRVTWELVPLPEGCRLRMSHTGFIGVKGSLRRKELQRTYDKMLSERLPRVLDRLASGRAVRQEADRAPLPAESRAESSPASPDAAPAPEQPPVRVVPPVPPPVPLLGVSSLTGDDPVGLFGQPAAPAEPAGDAGSGSRRTRILAWLRTLPSHRRRLLAVAAAVVLAVLTFAVISSFNVPNLVPPLGASPGDWPTVSPGGEPTKGAQPAASPGASVAPGVRPSPLPATAGRPGIPVIPGGGAAPGAPPTAAPGGPGGGGPGGGGPGGEPGGGGEPPAPADWAAAYRTVNSTDSGFSGELTVTNTGGLPARDWSVVVTLPAGAGLQTVSGASAAQSGRSVTFTASTSGKMPAGRSVTFRFQVRGDGATGPTGCQVSGSACAGL
jgi:uncharacterized protein YndB with AHSA1/START domain